MKLNKEKAAQSGTVRKGWGITGKLVSAIVISVMIAITVLLVVVYFQMSRALLNKSEALLEATTDCTLQETRAWMNSTLAMLEVQRDTIEYENMGIPAMLEYVKHTAGQSDAYPSGIYVALMDGTLCHSSFIAGPEYDPTVKSWYQDGLKSDTFTLGDVYVDENTQAYVVGVSGVLKTRNGEVRGVAAADIVLDSISQIVSQVQVEDTGGIFLVDTRTDIIIGHRDQALTGKTLDELGQGMYAYVNQQINEGKTGLSLYDNTYIQIKNVPGSDWMVVDYVSRGQVLQELHQLTISMLLVTILAILLLIFLVVFQVRRVIGQPVKELSLVATRIAQGELNQTIHYHSNDELGVLADDFNQVTLRLRDYVDYIKEISEKLREIAGGNLAFTLKNEYTGEFEKIKIALDEISTSLNMTMGQIHAASKDVAAGANQVSDGATTLSQGSTEQAAEIETLAGHMGSVSESVHKIATDSKEASLISQEVKTGLLSSNDKMQNMTTVIQQISEKSTEIHKIVKTIEEIAFQTNILALNAAVEAARAGAAGKGFAVVADEVRALAGKSSEAAQETTVLLRQTVESMNEGVHAAQDTANSMLAVVARADKMSQLIDGIADYTNEQASNAEEITRGIEQISIVVQTNVATAEESAAASEELSGQACMLRDLVAKFKLRDS